MASQESPTYVLRSLLFVPGHRSRFIEKAPEVPADVICLDLEDSVPWNEKPKAREVVKEAIPSMPRTGYLLIVRVNPLGSGLMEEELAAVVQPGLDGISLPKADSAQTVRQVDAYLTELEKMQGLPVGQVKIIPWIETAIALVNAYEICSASPRLIGASFGAEDFTTDLGIRRTKASKEIEWPRAAMAIACRAANILAIDTPVQDYADLEYLEADSRFALSLGYRGKYCIHPSQIEIVNRIFAPTPEEIEEARKIIQAYEEGEAQGLGAVGLEGVVIDWPVYVRARRLLEWADVASRRGS
ncbi:MAG: HpcH/HpaI aldolase/citrate lyase family protein [Dehalococcoidia bacterium]